MRTRGSAMLLTMVILAVLTLVAVGSLQLAQGDSVVVNRQQNYRMLAACAEAANRKLWAEYGSSQGQVQQIFPVVVSGTTNAAGKGVQLAVGHYDSDQSGPLVSVTFDDKVWQRLGASAMSGGIADLDTTNTFRLPLLGTPFLLTAHCRDAADRQYEIEMAVRFGL
ncbi:MAG TPA: hypothetical protein VFA20_27470 [Myxococcaceae bacterium]|nr:hypothetical protein [Myxococcaceae bacterium]